MAFQPPSKASKELANAAYDDFKRKAIDAAKKRAVAQNVDYDTFKNMVSVAHLRPIQAPNTRITGAPAPAWSFTPDGQRMVAGELEALAASAALLSDQLPSNRPSTSAEFTRDWRRCCPTPDHRLRYLQLCGPQGLRQVFRVEISAEVLKGVLDVLCACWLAHAGAAADAATAGPSALLEQALWVAEVLDALSAAGRFGLSLKLCGPQGSNLAAQLLGQLQEALEAASKLQDLGTTQDQAQPGGHAAEQDRHAERAKHAGPDSTALSKLAELLPKLCAVYCVDVLPSRGLQSC